MLTPFRATGSIENFANETRARWESERERVLAVLRGKREIEVVLDLIVSCAIWLSTVYFFFMFFYNVNLNL